MSETIKIEFKSTFKSGFLLVFSALLVSTLIDQLVNKQIEAAIGSPTGLSDSIWFWGALSLGTSLFFPLLLTLLCCQTMTSPHYSVSHVLKNKLEQGFIETLRAWGKTFAWCFVFIFPGLIKYTYYLLTPFVVMFSKKYENGDVDALEHSMAISKKFWWRLNIWVTVFYMLIPLAMSTLLDELRLFRSHPVTAVASVFVETLFLFIFHFLILKLFIQAMDQVENQGDIKSATESARDTATEIAAASKESHVSDF